MPCLEGQPKRKQLAKDTLKQTPRRAVGAHVGKALSALADSGSFRPAGPAGYTRIIREVLDIIRYIYLSYTSYMEMTLNDFSLCGPTIR